MPEPDITGFPEEIAELVPDMHTTRFPGSCDFCSGPGHTAPL